MILYQYTKYKSPHDPGDVTETCTVDQRKVKRRAGISGAQSLVFFFINGIYFHLIWAWSLGGRIQEIWKRIFWFNDKISSQNISKTACWRFYFCKAVIFFTVVFVKAAFGCPNPAAGQLSTGHHLVSGAGNTWNVWDFLILFPNSYFSQ